MLRETLNKRVFLKIFRNGTQGVPLRALDPGVEGLGIIQRSKKKRENPTLRLLQLLLFTFLAHGGIIKT